MDRIAYLKTRALVRANGYCALRWMPAQHADVWRALRNIDARDDLLALRQSWAASAPRDPQGVIVRLTSSITR